MEADLVVFGDGVAAVDGLTDTVFGLVADGFVEVDLFRGAVDGQDKVSVGGEVRLRAVEAEANGGGVGVGVGVGGDDEVVFEAALGAVVDEIDAGVDLGKTNFTVGGNVGLPLRGVLACHVIRGTRERLLACGGGGGGGSEKVHADGGAADPGHEGGHVLINWSDLVHL